MRQARPVFLLLAVVFSLSACQTNPPALRRTALLLADEVDTQVNEWDKKINAEREYYRKTDILLRRTARESFDLEGKYELIFRNDAFLDQALVEKKGVSLTALRAFLTDHNDKQREADLTREAQTKEAEQKASVTFAKLIYNRSALEEVANELRTIARQDSTEARQRLVREWVKRFTDEAKAKANQKPE